MFTSNRGKLLVIQLTLSYCLLIGQNAAPAWQHAVVKASLYYTSGQSPFLYGMYLSHERIPRAAETEKHSLLYVHARHLAAHPNFWTLALALYLDSTRPD